MNGLSISAAALFAIAASTGQGDQETIEELSARLDDRDARIQRLFVPFRVCDTWVEAGEPCDSGYVGTWALEGVRESLTQEHIQGPLTGEYEEVRSNWTGVKQTTLEKFGVEGELDVMTIRSSYGPPFAHYHPGNVGLRYYGSPWSAFMAGFDIRLVLPSQDVQGRACTVVALGTSSGAGFLVVWFARDEGVLALRKAWYRPAGREQELADVGPADRLRIAGVDYVAFRRVEVLDVVKLGGGVWLPSRAEIQSGSLGPESPRSLVEFDVAEVRFNDATGGAALDPSPVGPTLVDDQVEGRVYEVGGVDDEVTDLDRDHWENVRLFRDLKGMTPLVEAPEHHSFYRSSCGPNALLLVMEVLGIHVELDSIIRGLGVTGGGETNLQQLAGYCRESGLWTQPAKLGWAQLARYGDLAILRVLHGTTGEGHFAVGRVQDGEFLIALGPYPAETITRAQLEEMWAGEALIVSHEEVDLAALDEEGRLLWIAAAGVLILLGGGGLLWQRRAA